MSDRATYICKSENKIRKNENEVRRMEKSQDFWKFLQVLFFVVPQRVPNTWGVYKVQQMHNENGCDITLTTSHVV
jgi:hypothetical protein